MSQPWLPIIIIPFNSRNIILSKESLSFYPLLAAPEIISAQDHYDGKTADIWSCGVMLYVMLFCEYPFERPEDEADKHGFHKVTICIIKQPQPNLPIKVGSRSVSFGRGGWMGLRHTTKGMS
jgi:serine/threonine protein kinase